jgi:hypothetical protein
MPDNNKKPRVMRGEKARSSLFIEGPLFQQDRYDLTTGFEAQKYSIIARNPIVKTALETVARGVFWPSFSLKPNPKNDYQEHPEYKDLDDELILFVNKQLDNLGQQIEKPPNVYTVPSFTEFLESTLWQGRVYGYSVSEFVWKPIDGIWQLLKIKPKPSWNFDFRVDRNDELKLVVHQDDMQQFLKPARFVIGTWPLLQNGNYYGISDLQSIEHDVKLIERLEAALGQGGTFNAYKPLISHISINIGEDEYKKIQEDILNLNTSAIATFPQGQDDEGKTQKAVEFEVIDDRASQYALESLWNFISELIKRVNRALGIPDDLGQVTAERGSFARSKTQFNMYIATVEKCQAWLENVANRVVQTIIYYNYNNLPKDYLWPTWSFDSIEEEFDEMKARYFETLIKSGIINSDEPFIREAFEFPPADNEELEMETEEDIVEVPDEDEEMIEDELIDEEISEEEVGENIENEN